MNPLRQSTAATIKLGPFLDDTDGKTAEVGLSIAQADIRLSKNGGDFAQTNNVAGATHDENGYYDVPLDTTDTGTLGRIKIAVSKSGALPVWEEYIVVTQNVYDSMCSTDILDVSVTQWNGTAVHTPDTAGIPLVAIHDQATVLIDAIWDEPVAAHTTASTFGLYLGGAPTIGTTIAADIANVHTDVGTVTTELAKVPKSDSTVTWNATALASINTQVDTALSDINLDHLMKTPVSDITKLGDGGGNEVPDSTVLSLILCKGTDTDTYNHTTDSLESIRDKLPANLEDMSIVDTTGLVDITQAAADKVWGTTTRQLTGTQAFNLTGDITGSLSGSVTITSASVDAILDEAVDGTVTLRESVRLQNSVLLGKSSGGGTATVKFRDLADTKDRITATVDADGNRTAITKDAT